MCICVYSPRKIIYMYIFGKDRKFAKYANVLNYYMIFIGVYII